MGLFGAWVAYPAVVVLLAYGAGALVQLAAGRALALGIRLPCGLALVIAVLDLFTRTTTTAPLAVGVAVGVGVAGLVVAVVTAVRGRGDGGLLRRPNPHTLAGVVAAFTVFALYAAPIVLSGEATWSGFFQLDDTANWLSVATRALAHGRTLAGTPESAYQAVLYNYLVTGYPLGSFLPLGFGSSLLGVDVAWLTDPWMAVMAAMLVLALSYGARRALPRAPAWQPAAIAAVASMSALLYGYYLWGGMKELADAFLIATFAVSLPLVLEGHARVRAAIPALVTLWALVAAESAGGIVWIVPGGLVALGLLEWRGRVVARGAGAAPAVTSSAAEAPTAEPPPSTPAPAAAAMSAPQPAKAKPKPKSKPKPAQARAATVSRGRGGPPPSQVSTRRRKQGAGQSRSGRSRRGEPARWQRWLDDARARLSGVAERRPAIGGATTAAVSANRRFVIGAVAAAVLIGLYALRPGGWVRTFHAVLTAGGSVGLGDLRAPLSPLRLAGIWPSGDFRDPTSAPGVAYVLMAIAIAGAVLGIVALVRDRRIEATLYLSCTLVGAILIYLVASAWISAKALAAASPAIPFAALVAAVLLARWRRAAGIALAVVVVGGVLWSDVLGYHDVWLAPRAQLAELTTIDKRIAGQGPTLVPDPEVFAVRYFLRDAAPESPGELRARTDPLSNGQPLPTGGYADLDQLALGPVLVYRTIVIHRSPAASRPPYGYNLIYSGRYWQVWQRPPNVPIPIVTYLPLGSTAAPGAVPVCSEVMRLAQTSGVTRVVAAPVQNPIIVGTTTGSQPGSWYDPDLGGRYSSISGPGTARFTATVPTAGRYDVWLGGSIRALVSVSIDGHTVGSVRNDIQRNGQYIQFGTVTLSAGRHTVTLTRPGGQLLDPGSGGPAQVVGPLELALHGSPPPLVTVSPSAAGTLCGRTLDWIEGLGP